MVQIPPIVELEWLAEHPEVRLCDVRSYLDGRVGRDAYDAGHIPEAVFVDLDGVLAAPAAPVVGRHPLPSPDTFAAGLGALGIGDDDAVIAYDDAGGMIAGRLVYMLRVTGRDAALLDGGIGAWVGPLSTEVPVPAAVKRTVVPWPEGVFVDADTVAAEITAGTLVVDARAGARYRGEHEPLDSRPGHVPGALNLPFPDNLVDGRFLPVETLKERFTDAGIDASTIHYCGSGVSACNNLLAAEAAGLGLGRLYVASWSGWSSEPARAAALGD